MHSIKKISLIVLALLMLYTPAALGAEESAHDVAVSYFNVGKGDAMLVQADGKNYIIDTGKKKEADTMLEALDILGIEHIDAVFLTHTHKDHIGGMKKLAKKYDIPTIYSAEISMNEKKGHNKIVDLADDLEIEHRRLVYGDAVEIAEGLAFEVLGPIEYNDADDNDNSLVLRLRANGYTYLFTGDMQFAEEKTILESGADLAADILKVGNHGNADATSAEFAEAVAPAYAIITTDIFDAPKSANMRVLALLDDAAIHITQDFTYGLTIATDAPGSLTITEMENAIP